MSHNKRHEKLSKLLEAMCEGSALLLSWPLAGRHCLRVKLKTFIRQKKGDNIIIYHRAQKRKRAGTEISSQFSFGFCCRHPVVEWALADFISFILLSCAGWDDNRILTSTTFHPLSLDGAGTLLLKAISGLGMI